VKRESIVAWSIVVAAAMMRIFGAVRFPFEQDELYTIDEATNLFHTRLLPGIRPGPVHRGCPTRAPRCRSGRALVDHPPGDTLAR